MFVVLRKLLPEPVKRRLRGKHDSIKSRFWDYPRELVEIQLYRARGKGYLQWYADRLNRFAHGDSAVQSGMADSHRYFKSGDEDLELFREAGLKPHHVFLEIGCGFGRSAQHFVGYLEQGKYTGGDPSAERLRQCRELLNHRGVMAKNPQLAVIPNNLFEWVGGKTFDYIWAGAVFTHVPAEDLAVIFANVRKVMHKDSQFLFTYTENSEKTIERFLSKDWYYNFPMFQDFAARYGFRAENLSHMLSGRGGHCKGDRLARFTLDPAFRG
jgi:SAM-dependent methyltransferase